MISSGLELVTVLDEHESDPRLRAFRFVEQGFTASNGPISVRLGWFCLVLATVLFVIFL